MRLIWFKFLVQNSVLVVLTFGFIGFFLPQVRVLAATFVDNSQPTFNGTFVNTQWNVAQLGVRATSPLLTGTYTSPVKDSTSTSTAYQNFGWTTVSPHEKNLPNNGGSDSGYTNNMSMTGNLGLWHMDEATAIARVDSSGLANNTTCATTCPTVLVGTLLNNSATFSTTATQFLNTANGNSIKNTTAFTISAWIRPTSVAAGNKVIYEEPTSTATANQRASLSLNGANLNFRGRSVDAAVSPTNWVISTTTLVINQWYHVVAIFNSDTDTHQLYINNVVQNNTVTEIAIPNTNPIVTPKIGQQATGTGAKFVGSMDEVAIFNRAVTATEVNNMFFRGFRLRFQVQSCVTVALCTLANFRGPGGTNATWYSELGNTNLTPPNFTLTTAITPNRQYFQYQAQYANFTTASTQSALLQTVTVTYSNPPALPQIAFVIRRSDDVADDDRICDFGTVSTLAVSSCSYRLKVTTNSNSGYIIFVNTSGNLISGANSMANAASGPAGTDISAATLGIERYGVVVNKGNITGGTTTLNAIFNAGTNSANFTPVVSTSLISATGQNAPGATDLINTSLITHNLNISDATRAGNYTQTITYTVLATF